MIPPKIRRPETGNRQGAHRQTDEQEFTGNVPGLPQIAFCTGCGTRFLPKRDYGYRTDCWNWSCAAEAIELAARLLREVRQ